MFGQINACGTILDTKNHKSILVLFKNIYDDMTFSLGICPFSFLSCHLWQQGIQEPQWHPFPLKVPHVLVLINLVLYSLRNFLPLSEEFLVCNAFYCPKGCTQEFRWLNLNMFPLVYEKMSESLRMARGETPSAKLGRNFVQLCFCKLNILYHFPDLYLIVIWLPKTCH